jgi:RNA polymerase sigma-70 factor (ECF subfamily)
VDGRPDRDYHMTEFIAEAALAPGAHWLLAEAGGQRLRLLSSRDGARDGSGELDAERQVVDQARAGDPQALGHLYDLYFPKVYRYVLARTRDTAEAEDVTAEIFLKMLDGIGAFEWRSAPFGAWIFRIAHNHVISHVRKNGQRRTESPVSDATADPAQDFTSAVEKRLSFKEVMVAAQTLPAAQREVILLRFAVGLCVGDTALVLGKRAGTVKVLQHKAIARLQKLLAPGEASVGEA